MVTTSFGERLTKSTSCAKAQSLSSRRTEAVQSVQRGSEKIYEASAAQAYLYACIAEPIGFLQRSYATLIARPTSSGIH